MERNARGDALVAWRDGVDDSMIAPCARGLLSDCAAVAAALREPWSNGQIEGQSDRLKTQKRQIFGRANIDLLKVRPVART